MAFPNIDVNSEFFTPQEFPVEILEIAKKNDVITCCLNPTAKQFFAFMLFKEFYYMNDGISVFVQDLPKSTIALFDKEVAKFAVKEKGRSGGNSSVLLHESFTGPPPCHIPLESLSSIPTFRLPNLDDAENENDQGEEKNTATAAGPSSPESSTRDTIRDFSDLPIPCAATCSRKRFLKALKAKATNGQDLLDKLNLVLFDNAHEALRSSLVRTQILDAVKLIRLRNAQRKQSGKHPIRIVFLTVSMLHFYGYESSGFWRMEETFKELQRMFSVDVDTTSDVVALLRYSVAPKERIIPLNPTFLQEIPFKFSLEIIRLLSSLKTFLENHTFDPVSEFGYDPSACMMMIEAVSVDHDEDTDSIAEEIKTIHHPTEEPLQVIRRFESILNNFGPWCAERSLILLIRLVDRLKVRTPYERHYLLLGALHTRLVFLQAAFHKVFSKLEPLEVLETYSTPKLRAVLEILRRYDLSKPIEPLKPSKLIDEDEDDKDAFDEDDEPAAELVQSKKPKDRRRRFDPNKKSAGVRKSRKKQTSQSEQDLVNEIQVNGDGEVPHDNRNGDHATSHINVGGITNGTVDLTNGLLSPIDSPAAVDIEAIGKDDELPPSEDKRDNSKVRRPRRFQRRNNRGGKPWEIPLCGIVFVEERLDARMIFHYLKEAARVDPTLIGLNPTLAICSNPDYGKESHEAEMENKKREENLRKFRYREANLLIGTSIIEDGVELPKANLVIRFDLAKSFRSYLFSKGRAQGQESEFYIFAEEATLNDYLKQISTFKLVQDVLLNHSVISSPVKIDQPTSWDDRFPKFKGASLSTAISIVNRYCARLPSDTFTRLVPLWAIHCSKSPLGEVQYSCTLRLPINSPVKWPIKGINMPLEFLAKQAVALQTVKVLHVNGELDDELIPVGKEGIMPEPDINVVNDLDEEEMGEFRPGSTKRRQYYDKQLAVELVHCVPKEDSPMYLYWLSMVLTCPLPDEQNTRGRKLHPPELASQSFGILLSKEIQLVPSFPIFTRCGEVQVQVIKINNFDTSSVTPERLEKISAFHHYTFTSVLRLDKYLTLFDPSLSENSYYVVPLTTLSFNREPEGLITDLTDRTMTIDWDFLNTIWDAKECSKPAAKSDEERHDYVFREEDYEDAVVMPWYRNHDVPQYFYVAEICSNLTPKSQFPGCEFKTFDEYYQKKYTINIQCVEQPLLDVDHTSARLNFLTPRYVNRKGMALPTSSESTKKAKRENLEQKQILVPELCSIHPFKASFWRQAVCLPCILYRLNCLLLSNNIRLLVASEIRGLGLVSLPSGYKWNSLNFGWSLSDVLGIVNQKEAKKDTMNTEEEVVESHVEEINECKIEDEVDSKPENNVEEQGTEETPKEEELSGFAKAAKEPLSAGVTLAEALLMNEKHQGKSANEILSEEIKKCKPPSLEIGMWTNEMAADVEPPENEFEEDEDELIDVNVAFPSNLVMLDKNWTWGGRCRLFNHRVHRALYGSPTHWGEVWDKDAFIPVEDLDDSSGNGLDNDAASVNSDMSGSDASFLDEENSLKIQFHNGNTAEAMDKRKFGIDSQPEEYWTTSEDLWWPIDSNDEINDSVSPPQNSDENNEDEFSRQESLKEDFETRIKSKVSDIDEIVPWESISSLPARNQTKLLKPENPNAQPDLAYDELFSNTTPVGPPEMYPESPAFMKEQKRPSLEELGFSFSFDDQPDLHNHPGPSPCLILQALTMSNANDGLNLERLETIGDSFLKYAITSYLFCSYENIHEGKLSHLRSKQVSNVHLYRLGRRRGLGKVMVASKFEPHDNWLPPGYHIPKYLDKALIQSKLPPSHISIAQITALKGMSALEMQVAFKRPNIVNEAEFVPYNLVTQQSIPDKSIADCVEALIGAYLTSMGPQGALLFMSWLGMRVLPCKTATEEELIKAPKDTLCYMRLPSSEILVFERLKPPISPLLRYNQDCEKQLDTLLKGYDKFEDSIGYHFRDRSYLLQAFTHASYSSNTLTDCYQRLEFLGDAILDYLITRHLYEDPRQHSPGSLTDLRSALVNNTIFASLAVKNGFHKYFRHASPGLSCVLQKFVTFQEHHGNTLTQDYYLMDEEECEEAEDIEVPKALGDVFESVAGAIFLDSGMSLDAVWSVYFRIMRNEIDAFTKNVPKSPIRELLEMEPETAKFGKPEKLWDGRRVRVSVEIFGVGVFRGIGRNYRIAKCTAAKCALRHVKRIKQNLSRR